MVLSSAIRKGAGLASRATRLRRSVRPALFPPANIVRPRSQRLQTPSHSCDAETGDLSSVTRDGRARGSLLDSGSPVADAVLTAAIGLGADLRITAGRDEMLTLTAVFLGGIAYVAWYKKNVLDKIELAFARGYDPALELVSNPGKRQTEGSEDYVLWSQHVRRREQPLLDRIVGGSEVGQYYLLLGPKGTGKGTMILDAMRAIEAEGVAMCDAHPDLEVFRLRLGKALNYEFNEDTQTSLFQRRDPREAGPSLDIERAFNKLEKVALQHARRTGRPLVLILNNVHFFNNDDGGKNILLQMQQRAESWAAAGILTLVFSSDDFWPFLVMRRSASRMQVVGVADLSFKDALRASAHMRVSVNMGTTDSNALHEAVGIVGGRLSYLAKISKRNDIRQHVAHMLVVEKAWLLSVIGLIPDCDDDVMDEQKWSSCSWLLLREFVKQRQQDERKRAEAITSGELSAEDLEELPLPKIPYYKCRQIMTRADFLEDLDRANIITIDTNHDVTPDSVLLLHAAEEVVAEEGFDDLLDGVRNRVDEIESLHRTRELTFKDVSAGDRIRLSVDKGGSLLVS